MVACFSAKFRATLGDTGNPSGGRSGAGGGAVGAGEVVGGVALEAGWAGWRGRRGGGRHDGRRRR